MMVRSLKRIGIALWLSEDASRSILTGALEYINTRQTHQVRLLDFERSDRTPIPFDADGWVVIAGHNENIVIDKFPEPKVVVPNLSGPSPYCCIATDSRAVGRMAATYVASLGLNQFALCGHTEKPSFAELTVGYRDAVVEAGGILHPVLPPGRTSDERIAWIESLPTPCGILMQKDSAAREIIPQIIACNRRVPEDHPVIAIGNAPIMTLLDHPTITSIMLPLESIGRQAVQMLERRMAGQPVESIALPPVRVVERQSTSLSLTEDPLVTDALKLLGAHVGENMNTNQLARHLGVSRRTLENHFHNALGRGVHEEFLRLRLNRALNMLASSDMLVKEIALSIGIRHMPNFNRLIRQRTGMTPTAYRRQHAHAVVTKPR